jgi:hydrogenase nickel incorporation protein HypB
MCDTCGCGDTTILPVDLHERILAGNDRLAQHLREHFDGHGVFAINLMGSPGAGKTALIEATARRAAGARRMAALAADLATERDAARLQQAGIPALTITTGTACHLDAQLVHRALHHLACDAIEYLFIENVGNLVCPAIYDLGQAVNVVVLSVTEGEDKPLKYPVIFGKADVVVLTKIDLLPHLPGVTIASIADALATVMPEPLLLPLSALTGVGVDSWVAWLDGRAAARARARRAVDGTLSVQS